MSLTPPKFLTKTQRSYLHGCLDRQGCGVSRPHAQDLGVFHWHSSKDFVLSAALASSDSHTRRGCITHTHLPSRHLAISHNGAGTLWDLLGWASGRGHSNTWRGQTWRLLGFLYLDPNLSQDYLTEHPRSFHRLRASRGQLAVIRSWKEMGTNSHQVLIVLTYMILCHGLSPTSNISHVKSSREFEK